MKTSFLIIYIYIIFTAMIAAKNEKGEIIAGIVVFPEITKQKQYEKKLQQYSQNLEELVDQRTAELNQAQERLVRQEKLAVLGQLAGGVSHELRNPLGAIKNVAYYLSMILDQPNPEIKEMPRTPQPEYSDVQINELLHESIASLSIPEMIELDFKLDPSLDSIKADPHQLNQVFTNLIENALKAMPEGGKLSLKTQPDDHSLDKPAIIVHISDTGVGISKENIEKIFEPLFTTRARGIGLGLSVVQNLIAAHKGDIQVESQLGIGTTFSVILPIEP